MPLLDRRPVDWPRSHTNRCCGRNQTPIRLPRLRGSRCCSEFTKQLTIHQEDPLERSRGRLSREDPFATTVSASATQPNVWLSTSQTWSIFSSGVGRGSRKSTGCRRSEWRMSFSGTGHVVFIAHILPQEFPDHSPNLERNAEKQTNRYPHRPSLAGVLMWGVVQTCVPKHSCWNVSDDRQFSGAEISFYRSPEDCFDFASFRYFHGDWRADALWSSRVVSRQSLGLSLNLQLPPVGRDAIWTLLSAI